MFDSQVKMNFDKVIPFIERNCQKNRTIVTNDILSILLDINETSGLDYEILSYPSASDYETWVIPPQWDVKDAWIKDASGKVVASYEESPLFVAPYSCKVNGTYTKSELEAHFYTQDNQPEAFCYNHRIAFDYQRRLKEWSVSFPRSKLEQAIEPLEVLIDVDVKDGNMLISELELPGSSEETVLFIADYCHPGQVNDSFSGLVLFMELMRNLSQLSKRKYTYRCIFVPETVGTAVYFSENQKKRDNVKCVVFSDNVAWGEKWFFKKSRQGDSYFDTVIELCCREFDGFETAGFYELIGNDEHTTNSPQINIPSLSLQKYFFDEYHSSQDNIDRINKDDLNHALRMMCRFVEVIEQDETYEYSHSVPFYMTRFGLYSDCIYEPELFQRSREIMNLIDGGRSCVEIAIQLSLSFDSVHTFMQSMLKHNLIKQI
jgi:aminopeptidase-like protein